MVSQANRCLRHVVRRALLPWCNYPSKGIVREGRRFLYVTSHANEGYSNQPEQSGVKSGVITKVTSYCYVCTASTDKER